MLFSVITLSIIYSLIVNHNNFSAHAANQGKQNLRQQEKLILDSIIGGDYDARIRPSGVNASDSGDGPAYVRVNVYVRSISRIDDVTMEYSVQITFREQWSDDRLVYDDLGGQVRYLTLTDQARIWKPDLFFSDEKEGHFHDIIMPNVLLRIHPNGSVLYSIRISLVLACPMDLKYYPLDNQICTIKMASYGYTTEDVVFIWKEDGPVQVTSNLHLPRFTLTKFETDYCTSKTNTGEYSCVIVNLIFKREFSYYLIQIYIPCIMLVIVSWVSFWLDPNAIPARVSLGVTTLLTMATQISGINASLPPVSYTKAIDVWTGVCLTFVFGALLEFALVNYASRADAHRAAFKKKQDQSQMQGGDKSGHDVAFNQSNIDNAASFPFASNQINSNSATAGQGINFQSNPTAMVQNQGWDLETNFDFDHLIEPSSAGHTYGMKAVMRPRGGNGGPAFGPMIGGPINPLLGPGTGASAGRSGNGPPPIPSTGPPSGPTGATAATTFTGMGMFQSGLLNSSFNPVHATSLVGGQNWCNQWLKNIPTRSKRIDVVSRIFFPVMFGMFNMTYWLTYTYFNVQLLGLSAKKQ